MPITSLGGSRLFRSFKSNGAGIVELPTFCIRLLVYDFLEVVPRTIQHYGVEIRGLRYWGDAIRDHVNEPIPYGGVLTIFNSGGYEGV